MFTFKVALLLGLFLVHNAGALKSQMFEKFSNMSFNRNLRIQVETRDKGSMDLGGCVMSCLKENCTGIEVVK